MQLHHISLRVQDAERSRAFYEGLCGMQVYSSQKPEGGGEVTYLQDPDGGTMVELIALPNDQKVEGKGMFFCFGTDRLEEIHKKALEGGWNPSDIREPGPNIRYFYVYDPDGLSIQFREY